MFAHVFGGVCVSHIFSFLCCVFCVAYLSPVSCALCAQCCQLLWLVHSGLPLRLSLKCFYLKYLVSAKYLLVFNLAVLEL